MGKLIWDPVGDHKYKIGEDMPVVFPWNPTNKTWADGVAWNGLTKVTESPSGADESKYYANNKLYLSIRGLEELGFTLEGYQSPEEFDVCDGQIEVAPGMKITAQKRIPFCFAYRRWIGNDTDGIHSDYEIHIIYNATCSPTEEDAETINESPEPGTMSWECSATPVDVPGYDATPRVIIKASNVTDATKLAAIEDALFGRDADAEHEITEVTSHILMPSDIMAILNATEGSTVVETPGKTTVTEPGTNTTNP